MGQHKNNPTAKAAKAGKLPPKPRKMSKRESDCRIMALIAERTGINKIIKMLGEEPYA